MNYFVKPKIQVRLGPIFLFDFTFFLQIFSTFFILKQGSSIFNTLKKMHLKKVKESEENEEMRRTLYIQELQDIVSNVADRWRRLKGMQEAEAVVSLHKIPTNSFGFGVNPSAYLLNRE